MAADDRIAVERQLEIAQQITHIGSWEWNLAANTVAWSDELYRIYGLAPRSCAVTLETFLSRVLEEDRAMIQREVQAALVHGGRFQWNERIVRPDGSIRILDTVGEVIAGRDGKPAGLIGTCRDVTEERARDEQIRLYADIVRHVQIGLSVWAIEGDAETFRLIACNPEAEHIAGQPMTALRGKTFREIAPYAMDGEVEKVLRLVGREQRVHEAHVERSRDPRRPARALSVKGFPLPGPCVGLAIEDVTEATFERRLQTAEHHVLETIARGAPLAESLTALVLAIEDHSPPVIGSVLLLDAEGVHVRHGAAPHLPEVYWRAIDGLAIGPRAGSCGTAAFLKKPVFVEDIAIDTRWDEYRDLALPHGLRACWSIPILGTDERVLGTFAFYYATPRKPTEPEVQLALRVSRLAGIAIERKQMEDELRELSAHAESVREDERTSIAREIHDELGQALTALKMDIAWIVRRSVSESMSVTKEALIEKLSGMSKMTDEIIHQVRRISAELRPGVLDDLGLVAAIEWQASEFEERTGTTCVVRADTGDAVLSRDVATAAFRIFQEALTNVTRHAEAKHVDVTLDVSGGWLRLDVKDDGKGLAPDAARSSRSLGLLGIRERARRLGGGAAIEGESGKGTHVSLRIPLAPERGR